MTSPESRNLPARTDGTLPVDAPGMIEMDLPAARKVLQSIVDTPEGLFRTPAEISTVGGYDAGQILTAYEIVTEDIVKDFPKVDLLPYRFSSKDMPDRPNASLKLYIGEFQTGMYRHPTSLYEPPPSDPAKIIILRVEGGAKDDPEMNIPLTPETFRLTDTYPGYGFIEGDRVAILNQLRYPAAITPDWTSHIWRGYRWAAANMLNWENERYIAPGEVNNYLSAGDPKKPAPKKLR